jgi:predicted Abi (CAAX) family protease
VVVRIEILVPEVWQALGGVMQLRGDAFVTALSAGPSIVLAVVIVLAAGLSEAFGQSIVLFANRVKPARFFFSLLVDALLFTFGYAFLVLSTWVVCQFPGTPHIPLRELAIVFAMSYAPMLFAFLTALPYLGSGLLRVLRIWHLLAMVVGIAAVGRVDVFSAATYVWLGWLVMVLAQRSFGKPIVNLGARILDAVAGVKVMEDAQIAIGRAETGAGHSSPAAAAHEHHQQHAGAAPKASKHPKWWLALCGLLFMALLAAIVALAMEPVRQSVFGWQEHLPTVLRLPLDLLWLAFIALLVAAFMAPFETLGWWAGWYGDRIDTSEDTRPSKQEAGSAKVARYIVYLDGIAQSSGKYTPDIETFLDALSPELPENVRLVRGVMAYSVLNKPLDDDPILSRFWKVVDARRGKNINSLLGMLINLRNVTIVAVSADPRYGAMYNFGIADVIYRSLIASGYRKKSGVPVTLIGYSGGGQMACGAASFLKRALDAPVDVISLGGVISGNDPILELEHLYHLVGEKDFVERIGPVMFSSRWPIAVLSNWNRAKRMGALTWVSLGPVAHQIPGGMLDPDAVLPDGRTNLRQTLDYINSIVTDRFVAKTTLVKKPSNYQRYVEGTGSLWRALASSPSQRPATQTQRYLPVAQWIGRLILPQRSERFGGALLAVSEAPPEHASLAGTTVQLRWSDDPSVRERLRAVVHDVSLSAEAQSASTFGGSIMPVRVNRWRMVDPLESLAGAHPIDDVVVKLVGNVDVTPGGEGGESTTILRIEREPVQITGRYYGLVKFLGPAPGTDDGYRALHFDRGARTFAGEEDVVRMPPVVPDLDGRANSCTLGIDRSPLNDEGWYAYGAFDEGGTFVVQALGPRALLRADGDARATLRDAREAYRYARREAWHDLVAAKGGTISAGMTAWKTGEVGLLVHTYGGIGGKLREKSASFPLYFGHFAYGVAEALDDPLAGEPRWQITYYQVYAQNTDGLIAGALDWSRYMGDRQFGWAGVRPVCEAILRDDAFTGGFTLDGGGSTTSALDVLVRQLEVMTARYRIGDGTGGTFVGAANNCSQDSNRALFGTLRALTRFVETHPDFEAWVSKSPVEFARYRALVALEKDLRKKLQPFGAPRRDWSENDYNLGTTMEDDPVQNVISALGSWRCILPRLAFDTIVGTFLRRGASLTVNGSNQIGGERTDISPVVPSTL